MNHKKLRRLYREERLRCAGDRVASGPLAQGLRWSVARPKPALEPGFLSDAFADGRRFRILAIVDDFTVNAWR